MRRIFTLSLVLLGFLSAAFVLPLLAQQSASELAEEPARVRVNFNAVAILRWYAANLTTTFSVGTNPVGVAFDGANIWVANRGSNNVTKLRASDGTLLGTFDAAVAPVGVAFDGANIWVTSFGSNTVSKL